MLSLEHLQAWLDPLCCPTLPVSSTNFTVQTALWGQNLGNDMLTMPVIMQACCSNIWGLRELLQSAGKCCIQVQASAHPLLDRDVLSYQICGYAAACTDAAGLKLVVGSQDTFVHSKIQRWQQRHTYRDFDHVGDKGTSHHTCKEAENEVMHFPPAWPIYCIPHNKHTGRAKGGQYWDCPSRHCVLGVQGVAVPPNFL